jgi:hypothetical protein
MWMALIAKMQNVREAFNAVHINSMSFANYLKGVCLCPEVNRKSEREICCKEISLPQGRVSLRENLPEPRPRWTLAAPLRPLTNPSNALR